MAKQNSKNYRDSRRALYKALNDFRRACKNDARDMHDELNEVISDIFGVDFELLHCEEEA